MITTAAIFQGNHDAFVALACVHVVLFVLWIGTDLGAFYTSWRLTKPGRSPETRQELVKIMLMIDRSPRMAGLLMAPIAFSLAYVGGLGLPKLSDGAVNAIFWPVLIIMGLMCWALVITERKIAAGEPNHPFVVRYRILLRIVKLAVFGVFVSTGILSLTGSNDLWLTHLIAIKALLFGLASLTSLWIEYGFRDFGPAMGDLMRNGETPERMLRLKRAIVGAYPPILTLFALVTTAAVCGVAVTNGGF